MMIDKNQEMMLDLFRYYEDISLERDRIIAVDQGVRDSRITINCSKPQTNNSNNSNSSQYENTKW